MDNIFSNINLEPDLLHTEEIIIGNIQRKMGDAVPEGITLRFQKNPKAYTILIDGISNTADKRFLYSILPNVCYDELILLSDKYILPDFSKNTKKQGFKITMTYDLSVDGMFSVIIHDLIFFGRMSNVGVYITFTYKNTYIQLSNQNERERFKDCMDKLYAEFEKQNATDILKLQGIFVDGASFHTSSPFTYPLKWVVTKKEPWILTQPDELLNVF